MMDWILAESEGHYFFYAYPVALLLLFILMFGRRAKFLVSCVIMTVLVVNPWFYQYWDKLGLYAYWRILWIVPVIAIVTAVVPALTERAGTTTINKPWISNIVYTATVSIGILGIVLGGSIVYNTRYGQFKRQDINSSKLPESAVGIADRLLEIDNHP